MQEGLKFKLAVFHPYDDLLAFLRDAQLTDIAQCAWCDRRMLSAGTVALTIDAPPPYGPVPRLASHGTKDSVPAQGRGERQPPDGRQPALPAARHRTGVSVPGVLQSSARLCHAA